MKKHIQILIGLIFFMTHALNAQDANKIDTVRVDHEILSAFRESAPSIRSENDEEPHYRGFIGMETPKPTIMKCYFDPDFKNTKIEVKQIERIDGKWSLTINKKISLTENQSKNLMRLWSRIDLRNLPQKDWLSENPGGLTDHVDGVIWIHELHEPDKIKIYTRDSTTLTRGEDVYVASRVKYERISRECALMSFVWSIEIAADIESGQFADYPDRKK